MKKRLAKSFCLSFIFINGLAQIVFAGHNETTRSKCRWYAKKYVAEAHLGGPGIVGGPYVGYAQSRDNGCEWAKADEVQIGACGKTCEARSYAGGNQAYGNINIPCKINWGGIPSPLFQEITESVDQSEEQNLQETGYNVDFGPNAIDLSNISIHLVAENKSTRNNTYTVTIWLPQDDVKNGIEDQTITPEKTLVSGTVTLINGHVSVSGSIFTASDFRINSDGLLTTVDYVGGSKHLATPLIDDNMDIEVSSTGDIKDDETALFRKIANTSVEPTGILLYPNPSCQNVTVEINGQRNNEVTIQVYDATGKQVLKSSEQIKTDNALLPLNTSSLASGEYFILISSADQKMLKQFIKK